MENEIALIGINTLQEIKDQIEQVHLLMTEVMIENEHYGIIPGTKKKSLYKQGAEKLSMMFRLAPEYQIQKTEMENGHREINVVCKIIHIPSGTIQAHGVGSCSTMESKFRYRNVSGYDITDDEIPKDVKENRAAYRKQGYGMQKTDQGWMWVKYKSNEKQENPDIADVYNTVLKMAKKRAHIDAVLTATAASDIFTQDYEPGEDQPQFYMSIQEAIDIVNSSKDLIELETNCKKFKKDHGEGKTGWSSDNWKSVAFVMAAKKDDLENKFAMQSEEHTGQTREEEPARQTRNPDF